MSERMVYRMRHNKETKRMTERILNLYVLQLLKSDHLRLMQETKDNDTDGFEIYNDDIWALYDHIEEFLKERQ